MPTPIRWIDDAEAPARCHACGDHGVKRTPLQVRSPFPPYPDLRLFICEVCGSAGFSELVPPDYEETGKDASFNFYLEQNAGIDEMAEPLFAVDAARIRRFLEVGCAYGFSLDFARATFGWTVKGIDPGPGARAGRTDLDLDIVTRYLTSPEDVGGEAFDLVLCSELIEHFHKPEDLLGILRSVLAPQGVLLLTTPNAAAIRRETPEGDLLRILCPGFHPTLYARPGLEAALRRAGFTTVHIQEQPYALKAAAAAGPVPVDLDARLDRTRYRRYLQGRAAGAGAATSLGLGMRYRLLKEYMNAGDYAAADALTGELTEACRRRWRLDLDAPERFPPEEAVPPDLDAYHLHAPFCLCGLFYFFGMLAWQHRGDPAGAMPYFAAAAAAAERLRSVLRKTGADDGETQELGWRARGYVATLQAQSTPEAALAVLERFATEPIPLLGEVPPAQIAADTRRGVFVTLAAQGAYEAANQFADAVEAALPDDDAAMASVAVALGFLYLNHRRMAGDAARWFGRGVEASERLARRDPRSAALLWPARLHQAMALADAGDRQQAGEAIRPLLKNAPAGLPEIAPELRLQAEQWARTRQLPV